LRLKINKTGSFKHSKKYLQLIKEAKVYDVSIKTPVTFATNMTAKINNEVFLKREDLQPIFSFKSRGAYNKITSLTPAQKKKGVIAASAGNHAQGVAFACKKLKIPCLIVMPVTTPDIKVRSVKNFGAKIILEGDNFNQAVKAALKLTKIKKLEFIHPYDDQYTIAEL
jgi:threonine dehydratase